MHESDDQLELYALDRLPDDAVERVEEHLIVCEVCCTRLDEVGTFAHSMRRALRELPPQQAPRRQGWFEGWQLRLAIGGAVAFAVILAVVAYRNADSRTLAPVASVTLSAMRGSSVAVTPARETQLTLEGAPDGPLTVQVVDSAGKELWSGTASGANQTVRILVSRTLPVGTCFIRLKNQAGALLGEYGLEVSSAGPAAPK